VNRHKPVQRRSRERVSQILKAAGELLATDDVEALTTRVLSDHTGIPVATIYRYFEDRDEIIAAYLDSAAEDVGRSVATALLAFEKVTFRSLSEAVARSRLRYFEEHPEAVAIWFGGRLNPAVADRVRARDARLATSLRTAVRASGMLSGAPEFSAELLVRLYDRMFEFAFITDRSPEERERIVFTFVEMVIRYMESFATPEGIEGIPAERFVRALMRDAPPGV
jgi:AcrR family transcriptional regulator